jgi:hypothetical protein
VEEKEEEIVIMVLTAVLEEEPAAVVQLQRVVAETLHPPLHHRVMMEATGVEGLVQEEEAEVRLMMAHPVQIAVVQGLVV